MRSRLQAASKIGRERAGRVHMHHVLGAFEMKAPVWADAAARSTISGASTG